MKLNPAFIRKLCGLAQAGTRFYRTRRYVYDTAVYWNGIDCAIHRRPIHGSEWEYMGNTRDNDF